MTRSGRRRVLVTGGAGFIGSHLVDHLVAAGDEVTVLDNLASGKRANLDDAIATGRARLVVGSVLDTGVLDEAARGHDIVFHLAVECVRRSLGRPLENHEINATGTLATLEAARRAGVGRVVYCSSSEVYGNASDGLLSESGIICEPVTVYGAAKLAGELYAKAYHRTYDLETVVVRPFNAYGPREHHEGDLAEVIPKFLIRVLNGLPPVVFGSGENGRDFTYVAETARGIAAAAECDDLVGEVVNIARGEMVTVREVADAICRLCQRPDLEPELAPARPGDVHRLHADTDRARRVLGYEARIDFDAGLERYLEWFSATHPDPAVLLEHDAVNWQMPR